MSNIDYKALSEKIDQAHDVKELSALRDQLISCRETEQGMQNRGQEFTPQELNHAVDSTNNVEELRRLREYALQHRDGASEDQSESEGQNHGQSNPLGKNAKQMDESEENEKVKVYTICMSF